MCIGACRCGPKRVAHLPRARASGDVLLIESEHDDMVPHQVVVNYRDAYAHAHSVTYRVISGADHGLTGESCQQAYTALLVNWLTEMIFGARAGAKAELPARAGGKEKTTPETA